MYTDSGVCDTPIVQQPPPQLLNGHTPPVDHAAAAATAAAAAPSVHSGRVSVPKMGVRARISEWPPRREQSYESLQENGQCAFPSSVDRSSRTSALARMPWRHGRDAEFGGMMVAPGAAGFCGGLPSASAFAPLRQRSSSEVTLSEQDESEADSRAGMIREYGSTSSIDVQGIPEQSIRHMLSHLQQERSGQGGTTAQSEDTPDSGTTMVREEKGETRVRKKSGGTESSLGTSSLFRKLRSSSRGEIVTGREADDCAVEHGSSGGPSWVCTRSFAHYDAQSILFDLLEASAQRGYQTQRRNTATGASAASVSLSASTRTLDLGGFESRFSSADETSGRDSASPAGPGDPGSSLLLSCPHFLNETGGHIERNLSFLGGLAEHQREAGEGGGGSVVGRHWLRCSNASISVLEVPPEQQALRLERLRLPCIEHVDLGARYYHDHFLGKGKVLKCTSLMAPHWAFLTI